MTNDLIAITEQNINGETVQAVSARELHKFLESKQDFSTWIKARVKDYGFVENQDFTRFHKKMEANNATLIEYAITLDMAKELAMVERNAKGKEARQYFIDCEKKLKQPKTKAEMLVVYAQQLVEHERRLAEMEEYKDRVHRIEAKQQAFEEGHSFFTVLGYGAYKGITIDLSTAQKLGKQASALSRDKGIPIDRVKDQRFGAVNAYHETVLNECVSGLL